MRDGRSSRFWLRFDPSGRRLEALRQAGDAQAVVQPPPKLSLPRHVFGTRRGQRVLGSLFPGQQHARAVDCIVVVQVGQVPNSCEPPRRLSRSEWRSGSQVSSQWSEDGVVEVLVDQCHEGPDRALGRPGVARRTERSGPADRGHGIGHEHAGEREVNIGGDTVTCPGTRPKPVREALGQPALNAARRHRHDLPRHGVGQRF